MPIKVVAVMLNIGSAEYHAIQIVMLHGLALPMLMIACTVSPLTMQPPALPHAALTLHNDILCNT